MCGKDKGSLASVGIVVFNCVKNCVTPEPNKGQFLYGMTVLFSNKTIIFESLTRFSIKRIKFCGVPSD